MKFHFEGLDVPLTLPDAYLSVRMYENLQLYAETHPEVEGQLRYVRGALAAMLDDPSLIDKTDALPMSPQNRETWERIDAHLNTLIQNTSHVGDGDPLAPAESSPATSGSC